MAYTYRLAFQAAAHRRRFERERRGLSCLLNRLLAAQAQRNRAESAAAAPPPPTAPAAAVRLVRPDLEQDIAALAARDRGFEGSRDHGGEGEAPAEHLSPIDFSAMTRALIGDPDPDPQAPSPVLPSAESILCRRTLRNVDADVDDEDEQDLAASRAPLLDAFEILQRRSTCA